ncbi:MAG: hypothetical protein OXG05_00100 [Gammaproteobacteria bacterium]|nr:hypothetical protein [Gammaproteobacteria bacterium]
MALPEHAVNHALASVLNRMRQTWNATAELTGQIRENRSLRIDLLVNSPGGSYLVIENEYQPATTVAADAKSRLGKTLDADGTTISQVVELITPGNLKNCQSIEEAERLIHQVEFGYALHFENVLPSEAAEANRLVERIPPITNAYLQGSIFALAEFLAHAGLCGSLLAESIEELDRGVQDSIGILSDIAQTNDDLKAKLADLLMQAFSDDIAQGLGVAVTVIINAALFQQRLAVHYEQVRSLPQLHANGLLHQAGLIEQWKTICEINYWPIFSIAISVLEAISDPYVASRFVKRLFETTQRLTELGIADTHDLCGVVFQRFMTERKYLASFYTKPESATLLAHLAVPDHNWNEASIYENFRFADFACGTGALVHAVYQRIANLSEFTGGAPQLQHAHMMEQNITAADIVPSAAHLTATLLSSIYPQITYTASRVVVPQYGVNAEDGRVRLGSLELLDEDESFLTLFPNTSDAQVVGPKSTSNVSYELLTKPQSQDLVIMNPPYTRAMSDWIDAAHGTWKPFRALGNSIQVQQQMRQREKKITRDIDCYNGYQSMPSAFCGLADRMLKEGGTFAFVLPSTSLQGISWRGFRSMLAERYKNILVLSIAANNAPSCAWSADTALAEVLIVATKKSLDERKIRTQETAVLVNLYARPSNTMIAAAYASQIKNLMSWESIRSINEGPRGGTVIEVGSETVGELVSVRVSDSPWPDLCIRDFSLAQFATQLNEGFLWFPRHKSPMRKKLPISRIGEFATVGFADNNIANNQNAAFKRVSIGQVADYPMVWRNDSGSQRNIVLKPDQEGRIVLGRENLAFRIWQRRSRSLVAREVAYSSQSLITGFASESVIGGRGWPNVQLDNETQEKAFVLWGNCTLGVISFWYYSSRQQVRRSIVTVTSINSLPWLDPTALTDEQLARIDEIFEFFKQRSFYRLNQMPEDSVRAELDRRLLVDVLGIPASILRSVRLLQKKWCAEPSIKG